MNLERDITFRFSTIHNAGQISITFRLIYEINFSPFPFDYFICEVYEWVLIIFCTNISSKRYWGEGRGGAGLILACSNTVQYEI